MIERALVSLSIERSFAGNLSAFVALFEKWNRSINLSAASNRHEITEHLIDSLHVVPHLRGASRVLDVGSGGGFPVVVAAVCLPNVSFTSLEPVHKKHAFLRTAARELALPNLEPLAQRIEEHDARDYDVAMSRATFDLAEWLTTAFGFLRTGGAAVGFEAIQRNDLPGTIERREYHVSGKRRAIVIARPAE